MTRRWRWLLPALAVAELVLVRARILDARAVVRASLILEPLLLLVAGWQVARVARRYRRNRAAGFDPWAALEDGLTLLLPRPLARFAVLEPRLWVCLGRWLCRRWSRGTGAYSYHRGSVVGAVLIVAFFTAPVELLLIELLVPWAWLRGILFVTGVYALFWLAGLYASLVVRPHRLEEQGARFQYGILAECRIPYATIASVERVRRRAPGGRDGVRIIPGAGNSAYLAVGGRTDLTLRLRTPCAVDGIRECTTPVAVIHVAADEPGRLARDLLARI